VYARLACATGWTWEYIDDHMTIPRLLGFAEYWKESPPVNESVAQVFGGESSPEPPAGEAPPSLFDAFPQKVV
jgi:hypothetical protein